MRNWLLILLAAWAASAQPPFPVTVRVDVSQPAGEFKPAWAWFGYDEPNYTYMKDGKKLLTQLAELSPVPVYVRVHNLLTSGDGQAALKWGSTNAYTEDAQGKPVYNWTIVDRIFDTYIERKMKPLAQIGFMPEALTTGPPPYRHSFSLEKPYSSIFTGWAYPPKDYAKWAELVYQWVRHCVERYGRREVESWWWEVWNEPNIGYWKGTPEEYHKLYDYAADALKRALPTARIGGPHSTSPRDPKAREFLRAFIEHCLRGKNHAMGKAGAPLDYVGFHAKGRPVVADDVVRMGIKEQLTDIDEGFKLVASFPELKGKPVVIGECDPEGCAACSSRVYKQNGYRNGTMYSSYTAASFARIYSLAAKHGVNLMGIVTWAFEFEDQPWFDGFRDLATNGVEKPVLNVFRMFGKMGTRRVKAASSGQAPVEEILAGGVRAAPDVQAIATRDGRKVSILVSHYHDDDRAGPDAEVTVSLAGMPQEAKNARVRHYRIDKAHSNSFEAWKRMGSPQQPTPEQYSELERAGKLAELRGQPSLSFRLPRQGVSLIELSW
jgi:xylan 1,4-beta-xylosidase